MKLQRTVVSQFDRGALSVAWCATSFQLPLRFT
jgi:hypothetical protein